MLSTRVRARADRESNSRTGLWRRLTWRPGFVPYTLNPVILEPEPYLFYGVSDYGLIPAWGEEEAEVQVVSGDHKDYDSTKATKVTVNFQGFRQSRTSNSKAKKPGDGESKHDRQNITLNPALNLNLQPSRSFCGSTRNVWASCFLGSASIILNPPP